uniref:tRNA(Phe) (4-demethylwyosine(37)-C(7)) aminocarboxypropyltransferase n=1 Tax=Ditylum brightwellii TaxID=49249 RepID=A0A7S2EIB2_9STRA
MYCGCGAHTVPIAKSGFFDKIIAIELDKRLVDSCKLNCSINHCLADDYDQKREDVDESNAIQNDYNNVTLVHVFQGDAGEWARKSLHANYRRQQQQQQQEERIKTQNTTTTKSSSSSSWYNQDHDVLLVDPPRSGLDEKVCNMALNGTFTHIIYISCGRHALLKDLQRLCCCKEEEEDEKSSCFEVVDCALLDLFPRTKDSVESLVHLRRRRRPIVS